MELEKIVMEVEKISMEVEKIEKGLHAVAAKQRDEINELIDLIARFNKPWGISEKYAVTERFDSVSPEGDC
jgi:hypothetical protein